MNEILHDLIDGRRPRGGLTIPDGEKLEALEATIEAAVRPLRGAPMPDLSARVMAEVAQLRIEPLPARGAGAAVRRFVELLWSPRAFTVQLRPAYAVVGLSVILLLMTTPYHSALTTESLPEATAVEASAPPVYVQFRLEAQGAASVVLAGSFTEWKPVHELRETAPGTWSILLPLQPGVHDYAFVVDGDRWVADPHALQIDDGFGGSNSRIALPALPVNAQQS